MPQSEKQRPDITAAPPQPGAPKIAAQLPPTSTPASTAESKPETRGTRRKPARPVSSASEPRAYRINDVARATGLSRSRVYQLVNDGHLPKVKIGKRTVILRDDVDRVLYALRDGLLVIEERKRAPKRDPAELTADELREIKLSTLSLTKIAQQFRISSATARLIRAA